jgi:hypothetical protein
MRRLAILVLGLSLAATSAGAQSRNMTIYGKPASTKLRASDTFAPARAAEPYRAPAYRSGGSLEPLKPTGSLKPLDGGAPFKPFKGTSTYEGPGAFKPYKPPKMKSVYDH